MTEQTPPAAIPVKKVNIGIINGLDTWEVTNANTEEVIGYDQFLPVENEPTPDA